MMVIPAYYRLAFTFVYLKVKTLSCSIALFFPLGISHSQSFPGIPHLCQLILLLAWYRHICCYPPTHVFSPQGLHFVILLLQLDEFRAMWPTQIDIKVHILFPMSKKNYIFLMFSFILWSLGVMSRILLPKALRWSHDWQNDMLKRRDRENVPVSDHLREHGTVHFSTIPS